MTVQRLYYSTWWKMTFSASAVFQHGHRTLGMRPGGKIAGRWRVTDDMPSAPKPRRVPVSPAVLVKTLPLNAQVSISPRPAVTSFTFPEDTTLD